MQCGNCMQAMWALYRTIITCTILLHPRPPCPSLFIQARHSGSIVRLFFFPWVPPLLFLSHVRHLPRSSDTERDTFPIHHKSQCRSCIFQGQGDRLQGAPFSCWNLGSPHLYSQLYCVRPNVGKIDPGETVKIQGTIYLLVFNVLG